MQSTKLPQVKNDATKIQLARLSYVHFEYKDLATFDEFAKDFGLIKAWQDDSKVLYRGYGKDQYCYMVDKARGGDQFKGAGFVAQTEADFVKATQLEGAVIDSLAAHPGGGKRVTVKSPAGFLLSVIYDQHERSTLSQPPSSQIDSLGPYNGSFTKERLGKFQRFHAGPAMVHKVGHYGCIVSNFEEEFRWYTGNFNFVPTDVLHLPGNEALDVLTFMHLDIGQDFTDHHTLFLVRARPDQRNRLHHTAFEVEDFDTQVLGHEWLGKKGYHCVWGIGRHILGSQIFDYWHDPSGFTTEHYADGDVVNADDHVRRGPAGPLAVWGPELPAEFGEDGTMIAPEVK